jgi:hypothetical protein
VADAVIEASRRLTMKTEQRYSATRVGLLLTALFLATVGSATAWAQADSMVPSFPPTVVVPGYGSGIAGHVSEGPITPFCQQDVPCTGPLANAMVLVSESPQGTIAGMAVTNALGNFIVSVPPGEYVVQVEGGNGLRCPEAQVTVRPRLFTRVHIDCDTGIR